MDPNHPLTDMQANAAMTHELFKSYCDAGFTEPQALEIVIRLAAVAMTQAGQK